MDAEAQIHAKQQVLADNFARIGKVEPKRWLEPLTDAPWGYRRKGRLSVRYVAKKERVLVGFREESNPHRITSYNVCYTKLLRKGCWWRSLQPTSMN